MTDSLTKVLWQRISDLLLQAALLYDGLPDTETNNDFAVDLRSCQEIADKREAELEKEGEACSKP